MNIDDIDKLIIKELQGDLILDADIYNQIAVNVGKSKEEIIKRVTAMKESGILKRVGAVLKHRNAGYISNGMFVCFVDENEIEKVGLKLAEIPQVTHCYQRESYVEWPYNLYAMIHGNSNEEVESIVKQFSEKMKIENYEILYSTEELKKTSRQFY